MVSLFRILTEVIIISNSTFANITASSSGKMAVSTTNFTKQLIVANSVVGAKERIITIS